MFAGRNKRIKKQRRNAGCNAQGLERLEDRALLSASFFAQPQLTLLPESTGGAVYGYSPAQISKAYGFNKITFKTGAGNGAGQTIAIVDAYNDPNIAGDLQKFDTQFGLSAPASFTVMNQSGSTSNLPATNAGWAMEEALDVEWAHAIAPKASIVLVEANSANFSDLLSAVNTARNATGVSVVSMSWGSREFNGEAGYNSYFTTPANHQGVTFVASSGDSGSAGGPSFPAVVPSVLSVGGTSLNLTSNGAYASETGWNGSTGGVSKYESAPSYQTGAQGSGHRTSPDVSYDGNPNTGFAVYDSLAGQGNSGWLEVGGTSAGAPQWAALVAIANQGRAAGGLGSLDGLTGTLPTLYSLYSKPSTYSSSFHDVTIGHTSPSVSAGAGYDMVTGLGSPQANAVVTALVGSSTSTPTSLNSTAPKPATKTARLHVAAVAVAAANPSSTTGNGLSFITNANRDAAHIQGLFSDTLL